MHTTTYRFYCFNTHVLFSLTFHPSVINRVKSADVAVGPTHSWHPRANNNPSLPTKLLFHPSIPSPSSSSSAPSEEPSPRLLLRFFLLFRFPSLDSRPNFTLAPPIFAAFSPFTALGVAGSHWFEENWPWSIIGAGGRGAGFGGSRREMRLSELELVRLGDCVELVRLAPGEFDPDPIRLPGRNKVWTNPDHDVWVHMNSNCVLGSNPPGPQSQSPKRFMQLPAPASSSDSVFTGFEFISEMSMENFAMRR